jgi:hypothetical protein
MRKPEYCRVLEFWEMVLVIIVNRLIGSLGKGLTRIGMNFTRLGNIPTPQIVGKSSQYFVVEMKRGSSYQGRTAVACSKDVRK